MHTNASLILQRTHRPSRGLFEKNKWPISRIISISGKQLAIGNSCIVIPLSPLNIIKPWSNIPNNIQWPINKGILKNGSIATHIQKISKKNMLNQPINKQNFYISSPFIRLWQYSSHPWASVLAITGDAPHLDSWSFSVRKAWGFLVGYVVWCHRFKS